MRTCVIAILLAMVGLTAARAEGDARRGAQAYRACAACHSLKQGRNLTGPSLAGIFGRKVGSLPELVATAEPHVKA
jgi:cytochrome c